MVAVNVSQDDATRMAMLEKENKLLMDQLHEVQNAMERQLTASVVAVSKSGTDGEAWAAAELPAVFSENLRLRALVEAHQMIRPLEASNALNVRLGNLLIHSTASIGALLALPFRLLKAWRVYGRRKAPRALGGKSFSRVIATYEKGGFPAVNVLLSKEEVSPALQASAYTMLARRLRKEGAQQEAMEAAKNAYVQEPQPFRLKWLMFRQYEARNVLSAEALLSLLPEDTEFSESEISQIRRLRHAATQVRQAKALQESEFEERQRKVEKIFTRQREEKQQLQADNEAQQVLNKTLYVENKAQKEHLEKMAHKLNLREKEYEKLKSNAKLQIKKYKRKESELFKSIQENKILIAQLDQFKGEFEIFYKENQSLILINNKLVDDFKKANTKVSEQQNEIIKLKNINQNLNAENVRIFEEKRQLSDEMIGKLETLIEEKNQLKNDYKQLEIFAEELMEEWETASSNAIMMRTEDTNKESKSRDRKRVYASDFIIAQPIYLAEEAHDDSSEQNSEMEMDLMEEREFQNHAIVNLKRKLLTENMQIASSNYIRKNSRYSRGINDSLMILGKNINKIEDWIEHMSLHNVQRSHMNRKATLEVDDDKLGRIETVKSKNQQEKLYNELMQIRGQIDLIKDTLI